MAAPSIVPSIQSEGDLEVVLLHEAHELLAGIINPDLYNVYGEPPDQTAQFHDTPCFDLFLILAVELVAEGARSSYIAQRFQNWSLLSGLKWLASTHPEEAKCSGLTAAVDHLTEWLDREVPFTFWCADLGRQFDFVIPNVRLLVFGANTAKHHLLRLSEMLAKLNTLCRKAGYQLQPQELVAVLRGMVEEVRNRLHYHATFVLELYGNLLLALNRLIVARFKLNPTNRVDDMTVPSSLTSQVFRDLYGDVLVFKRYEEHRIVNFTPATTKWLRLRY